MKEPPGIHPVTGDTSRPDDASLPAEIQRVQETVQTGLTDLLTGALDAIDDSLFEHANNARSNNDQNRYFETMREVRIKRKGIEKRFQQALNSLFTHPPGSDAGSDESSIQSASAESLSLVQNDDLEEEVAVSAMINKARVNFQGTLLQLQKRLTSLYPDQAEDRPVNPLAPEHLCTIFRQACDDLDIQIRERLIVLKHFDRYVISNLGVLLDEANRILIQAGVMPDFRYHAENPEQTVRQTGEAGQDDSSESASDREFFERIRSLLALNRDQKGIPEYGPSSGEVAYIISKKELHEMLLRIPHPQSSQDLTEGMPQPVDLRGLIAELLQRQPSSDGGKPTLQQTDQDLIDLVSMLFEFILEDRNLSPPIQVLICRLQIPILKVVVNDRSFFSKRTHPARKLLNTLARAGIGWSERSEKNRDRLYNEIHRVVRRILDESECDIQLFDSLHQEFEQFLIRENRKAALVEQRTRESERGRIKSRKAQETVDQLLRRKLTDQRIPENVRNILINGWSRVMFLAYLRDDTEHRWHQSVRVVDDLLWCLQPLPEKSDRDQWIRVAPALIKQLRTGLEEVSFNSARLDQMMSELKQELTDAFRRQPSEDAPQAPPAEAEADPTPTAVERQQLVEDEVMSEHYATIDQISVGDWLEFNLVNGTCFRCRLSAIIEEADCFVFVNRMGLKVMEKTRSELAHEMRRDRLTLLDQGAFIDRALDAVMGGLTRKAS